ncbi:MULTISPECIES: transcription antitermination factor NusB [unclassified Cysteiniphilum]|uniref:transcription antitermination factor NusB n=1 Tax=Cysteiniphilum TaxID=2056696 RepID=UPI00124864E0|nr:MULTISPECIES: transcription antitermination factor NusB [unclassified Cysteiniphilum]MDA0910420.1 transcription antitermination factor NusB [Pseudomonadota bacterium]WHN64759.1 transcription antitermination factor NusB [Cysteiniphilum sp. QT6929]
MSLKVKERRRARFHAVQALYQQSLAHTQVNELKLQFYADNVDRHPVEWDFFYRLIDGVAKHKEAIDQKINHYAINDLASINPIDLAILRLGAYELIDCLDVPYQVVLNEYVDQAKELGTEEGHRFVNGLLDKIAKEMRQQ